ncbi:Tegumental protein [Fasciola gigantica]|uniref:Tegumental protein n=1 Tax=Fasciola gigantica TaxID=46835 RepID=A0A504Y835_FASGI|nr:Tegumental protein [Fasciola gigantica]
MDTFINSFLAVDADGSGQITEDELRQYVTDNKMDSMMVTKWMQLFDPDKTGVITLENFCDKLGLKPEEVERQRAETTQAVRIPSDIMVIYDKLPIKDQVQIVNETKKLAKNVNNPDDYIQLSSQLKQFADKEFGSAWQVAIVEGSYWITFSHLPENSFQFVYDNHAYLFWKIPE